MIRLAALSLALAVLLLPACSDADPAALDAMSGCYRSVGQPELRVARTGTLSFGGASIAIAGHRDKEGVSLSPRRGVYVDSQDHRRLIFAPSVLLLRQTEDGRGLLIPDYHDGPDLRFDRAPCR